MLAPNKKNLITVTYPRKYLWFSCLLYYTMKLIEVTNSQP